MQDVKYVDSFSVGSGTPEDPYLIHDVHELQAMKNDLNAHYALAQDIDASETVNWNNGAGFEPIGVQSPSTRRFRGSFDGRGHKIIDLYISRANTDNVGLFGVIEGAEIKNVSLLNGYIRGNWGVGGIVGQATGNASISHCYNTGSVTGVGRVGGIAGTATSNASISHCYNAGSVTGGEHVGGIYGNVLNSSVSHCYNTGSVTGETNTGGIVGYITLSSTLSQCYNTGSVEGVSYTGGIVGQASGNASINECYNTGSVTGERDTGGICGYVLQATASIIHCYNTGSVISEEYAGGIIGRRTYASSPVVYCYWNVDTSGVSSGVGSGSEDGVFGKTTSEMMQQATYVDWDFEDVWRIDEGNDYPRLKWEAPPGPIYTELRAPGAVIGLVPVVSGALGIVIGFRAVGLVAPGIVRGGIETVLVAPGIVQGDIDKIEKVLVAPGIVEALRVVGLVAPSIVQADVNIERVATGVVRGGIETEMVAPVQMDVRIRRRAQAPFVVNPKIRRIRRWPLEIQALYWWRVPKPPGTFGGD